MYINTTNGRRFCIEASGETTVHALKLQIMSEVGVPPQHQRLSFGGKTLEDKNATIASFGLDPNSEVDLTPTLRGGCGCECCGCGCKCNIL